MKVSVLGLGIIGGAWAHNLITDGLEVRCWNRTPKPFPNFTPSITDATRGAELILIVVADPPAVQSVLEQIGPVLEPGQLVVQTSTISAKWSRRFAEEVHSRGASYLEAPFTGSKPAAEQRKTVFYLGGEEGVIERARPVLQRLSTALLHIGPIGTASSLKLAMNVHIAGLAQALCESLTLCRREGIADETYFAALKLNAARSGVAELKEPKLRAEDYAPQFSVKHMLKDLRLAQETAGDDQLPLPQTAGLIAAYEEALRAGWGEEDFIGVIRLLTR